MGVRSASVEAVLFDLDGTLLDTHDLILSSFRHATSSVLGQTYSDEVLLRKVGQPLATQMWDFTEDPSVHEALLNVYREHNHAIHDEMVRVFDGVEGMLAQIEARGFGVGVVTSKMHALALRGLEVCGIAPYVSCLVGPDDYPAHKPDPGPVRHGCELLGIDPRRCLYVGDSPFDMQAGRGAGCVTVAVTWGMFGREALEEQAPDFMIDSPDQLPSLDALR